MTRFKGKLPMYDIKGTNGKLYTIKLPIQSGGKAGKGYNKTSTIQVIYEGMLAVKQIRYKVGDHESKMAAIKKALEYVVGKKDALEFFDTVDLEISGSNKTGSMVREVPGP